MQGANKVVVVVVVTVVTTYIISSPSNATTYMYREDFFLNGLKSDN